MQAAIDYTNACVCASASECMCVCLYLHIFTIYCLYSRELRTCWHCKFKLDQHTFSFYSIYLFSTSPPLVACAATASVCRNVCQQSASSDSSHFCFTFHLYLFIFFYSFMPLRWLCEIDVLVSRQIPLCVHANRHQDMREILCRIIKRLGNVKCEMSQLG